jgi:hypothetical protein
MQLAAMEPSMFTARLTAVAAVFLGGCAESQRTAPEKTPQAVAEAPPPAQTRTAEAQPADKPQAKAQPAKTRPTEKGDVATKPAEKPPPEEQPAPLDLNGLVQRLRDTNAVGLFTKVALKNQVDDLLGEFRAFYEGKSQSTLADLRRPYDLLVMKILALLQDSDPALAKDIVASRERIWAVLTDRSKFETISQESPMSHPIKLVALWSVVAASTTQAAEDPALLKDMTSVITLLGLPCGQVVSARTVKQNDHIATCKDGNRYHVFMNANGRVVAEKQ